MNFMPKNSKTQKKWINSSNDSNHQTSRFGVMISKHCTRVPNQGKDK